VAARSESGARTVRNSFSIWSSGVGMGETQYITTVNCRQAALRQQGPQSKRMQAKLDLGIGRNFQLLS
jgi:hypothetical protein